MADKKYYWLKLKRDFFKRHDIRIIESMPNGKDYILFYLKLLVESVDHNGALRFNETIPYSEMMLATITDTNIDIVRNAMKVFMELKMIEVLEDSTIFMAEVEKLLGTETYWAEKKRTQRGQCPKNVLSLSNMSKQELEIDKEIDKEIVIGKPKKHKYGEYKNVLLTDAELEKLKLKFEDWEQKIETLSFKLEQKGYKYKSHYLTILEWATKEDKPKSKFDALMAYKGEE